MSLSFILAAKSWSHVLCWHVDEKEKNENETDVFDSSNKCIFPFRKVSFAIPPTFIPYLQFMFLPFLIHSPPLSFSKFPSIYFHYSPLPVLLYSLSSARDSNAVYFHFHEDFYPYFHFHFRTAQHHHDPDHASTLQCFRAWRRLAYATVLFTFFLAFLVLPIVGCFPGRHCQAHSELPTVSSFVNPLWRFRGHKTGVMEIWAVRFKILACHWHLSSRWLGFFSTDDSEMDNRTCARCACVCKFMYSQQWSYLRMSMGTHFNMEQCTQHFF